MEPPVKKSNRREERTDMETHAQNQYLDDYVAEFYDTFEAHTDDVELIRKLVGKSGALKVLEPFCGTGRIFIPLALDGHEIAGIDQSQAMLGRARSKVGQLDADVRGRIALQQADVLSIEWPSSFDLVLLGGNCFFELASPEEQELCIRRTAGSLKPGGYVYVDNNHMEGELDESWRQPGVRKDFFPSGVCADGTRLEGTTELLWYDAARRLTRNRRRVKFISPDGSERSVENVQQKHPVSYAEVEGWLEKHGFIIEKTFGDRGGSAYTPDSPRAIFWARRA
ncbi:MAG: class I SAM-dependent methyltransferase [Planctomycetota bacterium]